MLARCLSIATSAPTPLVTFSLTQSRVAIVTLNDPRRLNALTLDVAAALRVALDQVEESQAGAVVLTGAGRAFSAGGDLNFLRARAAESPARNAPLMRSFYQAFLGPIRGTRVPIIAAVNGPAVGAGFGIALACDLRVAARDAQLGAAFTTLGLHPGMGTTFFLPRLANNSQVATRMLLTGELISGEDARRDGIVLDAVEAGQVLPAALALAERIAAAGPVAVRTTLRTLRTQADAAGLEAALWREADAQAQCYATSDLAEGVEAVAAKRKPSFTGT
jgi:enoyl-CoA hydratase/carnithine racemase